MKYLDFRKELSYILRDFGHKVAILHSDRRVKCPDCWSPTYDEPLRGCPRCLGTGYLWSLKVRKTWYTPSASLSFPPTPEPAPYQANAAYFYFEYDTIIDPGDYILSLERNRVVAVYQVTRRNVFYGQGGRREYIRVSVVQKPEELARLQKWWIGEARRRV